MSHKSAFKFLSTVCFSALCSAWPWIHLTTAVAQSGKSFGIRANVELVALEVMAVDKQGKPLTDLKSEDFRIYEDGKKQEILSFDEVKGTSGISSLGISPLDERNIPRGKTVLIIFDDSSIGSDYMEVSRSTAESFVKKHMQPQDLFAVASFGSSMKILQSFTGDRELVLAAISKSRDLPRVYRYLSNRYLDDLMRSLEKINYSIAYLKGQKSILVYSHDMGSDTGKYLSTLNSAKRSNVIFYAVDPSGVTVTTSVATTATTTALNNPLPRYEAPNSDPQRYRFVSESLAVKSGGLVIFNTNNINDELDKLGRQITSYYIIGFQSDNPKHDGTFRKLEVKTDLKGVALRYRDGYWDRRPVDVLASSKQEKALLAALASPGAATQVPVIFRPMYFFDSSQKARVLIEARISADALALRKKGRELETDLNVMGVAYSEDGSVAARFSQTLPVSLEKEKESEFRKEGLHYRNYFILRPGKYRLKIAVSDESNNLGSMEQSFEIPSFPGKGLAASSIVLAERSSPLPELIQNLQTQLLDESNPLLYFGTQIEPRAENRLPANSDVSILFRLYGLSDFPDREGLMARARLLNEKGDAVSLEPIPLKKVISAVNNEQGTVMLALPFKGVAVGKYRLLIEIADKASSGSALLQTDLEFTK